MMRTERSASRPLFVALAILSLALCIGANLVVFTVVKALWLRPNAIPDPDRVVLVSGGVGASGAVEGPYFSESGLQSDVRNLPVFEVVAGQVATSGHDVLYRPRVTFDAVGRQVEAIGVTSQYFAVMGLDQSIRGRDFTRDDDRPGMPVVGIISDRLWRTAFDASNEVIGATVGASPRPIRIVGVAAPDFHGARLGEDVDLWLPRSVIAQVSRVGLMDAGRKAVGVIALARLKHGVSIAEAQRAIDAAADPKAPPFARKLLIPISRLYGTPSAVTTLVEQTTMMWIAAAAAGIVLTAGCVTLMALVVVYYERRRQELAIRMALGCSQARMMRSLMLELGALSLAGVGGALLVASAGIRLLPSLNLPGHIDLSRFDLALDWRVVAAGVASSICTLALAAYAPVRRATRHDLVTELVASSSKSTTSSLRLRRDIVALQVAVTVIALIVAGPFVRTIVAGLSRQPRFDVEHVLFAQAQTGSGFESDRERAARQNGSPSRIARFVDELRALAGVTNVSLGGSPLGIEQAQSVSFGRILVNGTRAWQIPSAVMDVDPAYFGVMNMSLVRGRPFTGNDAVVAGDERPVVVTASLADALWPDRPGVDQVFGYPNKPRAYRVVGVVSDIAVGSLRLDERRAMFRAIDATAIGSSRDGAVEIAIKTDDPDRIAESVRRSITAAFPAAFDADVATGREILARDYGREQLGAWFFTGFGIVALALGVGGVFGLVAYVTEARRREMGIRLALGAMPGQLLRLIVGSGFIPVVAGTAAGLGVSAAIGRVISTSFLGMSQLSPTTYAVVSATMMASVAAAGVAAAWRVRRVAPSDVLRAE